MFYLVSFIYLHEASAGVGIVDVLVRMPANITKSILSDELLDGALQSSLQLKVTVLSCKRVHLSYARLGIRLFGGQDVR